MLSPAVIQRCKLCQQKIAEVERTLSSGDRNVLMSEQSFVWLRTVLSTLCQLFPLFIILPSTPFVLLTIFLKLEDKATVRNQRGEVDKFISVLRYNKDIQQTDSRVNSRQARIFLTKIDYICLFIFCFISVLNLYSLPYESHIYLFCCLSLVMIAEIYTFINL